MIKMSSEIKLINHSINNEWEFMNGLIINNIKFKIYLNYVDIGFLNYVCIGI